jgi:hypothetical protein
MTQLSTPTAQGKLSKLHVAQIRIGLGESRFITIEELRVFGMIDHGLNVELRVDSVVAFVRGLRR